MNKRDEILSVLQRCVLCGSCKAECPTYLTEGSESKSPRGRLYLLSCLYSNQAHPSEEIAERIYSCLLCGACEKRCPAGVDIMLALYNGRAFLKGADPFNRRWGVLLSSAFRHRAMGHRFARLLFPLLKGRLEKAHIIPRGFTFESYRFSHAGDVFIPSRDITKKGRVTLFKGCMVEFVFPHLGEAFVRVANSLGYEVVTLRGEQCCGAPLLGMGLMEEARRLASRNISRFRAIKADTIVSLCPTCVKILSGDYRRLTGEGMNIIDVNTFLIDRLDKGKGISLSALYHDPCHSLYSLGQYDEPRGILKQTGIKLLDYQMGCCGLAGTYALRNREKSMEMLSRNVDVFRSAGADVVVTSCPGCLFQFLKRLEQERVFHTIEIVDEYLHEGHTA